MQEWIIAMLVVSILLILRTWQKLSFRENEGKRRNAAAL